MRGNAKAMMALAALGAMTFSANAGPVAIGEDTGWRSISLLPNYMPPKRIKRTSKRTVAQAKRAAIKARNRAKSKRK